MKLKFLIFAMAVAAMGQRSELPPPREVPSTEPGRAMSPEEKTAPDEAPEAQAELRILGAGDAEPGDFQWKARPIVVFADTPDDPAFVEQMQELSFNSRMLVERDAVIITDSDPGANSVWRERLHPKGFSLVIMDKDGQVKLRKPLPWDVREISRAINKFPLRRQEIGRARGQ